SNLRDTYHRGGIRWNPAQARSQASSFSKRKRTKKTVAIHQTNPLRLFNRPVGATQARSTHHRMYGTKTRGNDRGS
ncbi:unnamed protein product, partial [Ectocarpus sp. 12 AP-2014]